MSKPDPTGPVPDPEALLHTEVEMEAAFVQDAGREIELVERASTLLVWVLMGVPPEIAQGAFDARGEPVSENAGPDALIRGAVVILGGRVVRAIRAARAALARGYEDGAGGFNRTLVELKSHRAEILADRSGNAATAWLQGKRKRGIRERAAKVGDAELWSELCPDSHGDPAPVLRLMRPEAGNEIELGPHRTARTRYYLLNYAEFAWNHAFLASQFSEAQVGDELEHLERQLRGAWRRITSEAEAGGPALDRRPSP